MDGDDQKPADSGTMNRIAIVRREKGRTQEWLGGELGLDQSAISKIENETVTVSLDNLRAISKALKSTVGELVEEPPYSAEAIALAEAFDQLPAGDKRHIRALVASMRSGGAGGSSSQPPS